MSQPANSDVNGNKPPVADTLKTAKLLAQNAWGAENNPAASDYRSDCTSRPTPSMLNAIVQCTLLDDVFNEDPTTQSLERFIAELTGKEDALLVVSGSMGNQVALRTHLVAPPHAICCDRRSHIIQHEAGGVATLSQAMVQPIDPKNGKYITLEEVQEYAVISDNVHMCPTRVIELENTLNGVIMPLEEVKRISAWAHQNDILVHMDGARLWEAVAAGAGSLKEYCGEVDSVSLCFSKGLGAPIGSIIAGTSAFIKRSRWLRKMIGGGLRQAGVVAAPARVAVEETFLGGKLAQSHENARRLEKVWIDLGGKLKYPVDTNMVWLDLKGSAVELDKFIQTADELGVVVKGERFVVHYQINEEALQRAEKLFERVLKA
ncbi:unnamed protein product [Periconia digitata]|uniref:Aromatic amino acid beta-eliminating lyase/threonine aldolase domain-containing protein n=1 Tax=Periconia digitata TaxID=1303443 RepID=A0A9W4XHI6_9PLEO|nr:unnamed protein product [Periconia digitata]